jgi:hypothetical protein
VRLAEKTTAADSCDEVPGARMLVGTQARARARYSEPFVSQAWKLAERLNQINIVLA